MTVRKQYVSTQSESELKTSTKRFIRKFDKEFLFNTSTESSNTTMMNSFQQEQDESLRFQESQEESRHQNESSEFQEDLRPRLSSLEMISQQQYEFKMMKMKLKMMKIEVQKLKCQEKLTERDFSIQSASNESSTSIY